MSILGPEKLKIVAPYSRAYLLVTESAVTLCLKNGEVTFNSFFFHFGSSHG